MPLQTYRPLSIHALGTAGGVGMATDIGWKGGRISSSGLTVSWENAIFVARWVGTAWSGSVLGCEIVIDDGSSRVVGTTSGTSFSIPSQLPVIFAQDVKINPGGKLASSCVFRLNALASSATLHDFGVAVGGVSKGTSSYSLGGYVWPSLGSYPFGKVNVGWEPAPTPFDSPTTKLKHVAALKEGLAAYDTVQCKGTFSNSASPPPSPYLFDVNNVVAPVGTGMTAFTEATGWTCDPATFGDGSCNLNCGILDADCGVDGELCNNADDDADGACDEVFPGVSVSHPACSPRAATACARASTGHCQSHGVFVCSMSQTSQVCDAQGCKSGTANLIQSGSVTTLTATAGTFRSSDHGHVLTITASNNPANRGNFTINYVNSTTVTFANASGVTEIGAGWNMYCPNEETILGCNGFDDDCDAVVDDCTDGVADSCCP